MLHTSTIAIPYVSFHELPKKVRKLDKEVEVEEGPGAWKKFGPIRSCNQYVLEYVGGHPLAGFCVAWCSDG